MSNFTLQLILLLTAVVAIFYTSTIRRGIATGRLRPSQAKDELQLRLQKAEHSAKPIKTVLTQTENEVAIRRQAIANLHNKFEAMQALALNKEQTEIARLLSKFKDSDDAAPRLDCDSAENDEELMHVGMALNQKNSEIKQADLSLSNVQGIQAALGQRLAKMKTNIAINQTTSDRARTESASLQREINNLQMDLNDAAEKNATQPDLEKSISALRENLNNKIIDAKTANNQRDMLLADMTAIEEQIHALDTDVQSLQKELQDSRKQHQNSVCAIRKSLTDKEAQFSDEGTADQQLADLQKTHKKLQHEHINALKKADQQITDLSRELDRSEIKIQTARDKAAATARNINASQIAELKKQLTDKNEASGVDTKSQRESVELKAKLRELNTLLAETMAEKKALQKQLDLKVDGKKSSPSISDSIGITDSTINKKTKNSTAKRKTKKAG